MRLQVFSSEHHVKKESTFFFAKRWKRFFLNLNQKISPLSVKKKIRDGVESRNVSNGTPLNPPLFWLDNIFNGTAAWNVFFTLQSI